MKVSYQSAKFCGQSHSGSGDIMFLVCHVISQDRAIKGSCHFTGGIPHCKSPYCQVWWSKPLWQTRYRHSCKYGYFTANAGYP